MDGPPPPSISEMSGSSYRAIELELESVISSILRIIH